MKTKPSECKLDEFNSCPRDEFLDILRDEAITAEFVDGDEYWTNTDDTVVFLVKSMHYADYVRLLCRPWLADDMDHEFTEDGVLFRFWWD